MTKRSRIVSFLPSATEMVCALGLAEQLVGITHECDYPAEIAGKPIVVRNALPIETMTQSEIDRAVTERLRDGRSLYQIDEALLRELAPDLIITQDLCQVCAPSGNEVSQVLRTLSNKPEILWMTPRSIDEIFENIRDLGKATDCTDVSERLIETARARLAQVEQLMTNVARRPRVFCMEWIDPVYCSGHWVPEMVRVAGGTDELGRPGTDSVRISWDDVLEWAPEILIVMPCGLNLSKVIHQSAQLVSKPHWLDLPAVRNKCIYAVDANSYFARPGPRVVEGAELLAHLIHPELFGWGGAPDAYQRLEFSHAAIGSAAES